MSIKLGEICNFQSGGTPSKNNSEFFDGTIPWVTTTALNGSKIDERNAATWITEKAIKESAAKIVPANSIMVGTRVGVGKVAVNTVEMSTSQDIISLIDINEERWDKDYLCKFLQSKSDYLNSQARGATIKGIKINVLAELAVPDISVKEQCRISEVLNTVTKLINARQQQLAKLDELVKARFVEMFGKYENGTTTVFMEDVSEMITVGIANSATHAYAENGVIMFRNQNIKEGFLDDSDLIYITEEFASKYKTKQLKENDLLITRTGYPGIACIVPKKYEGTQTFTTLIVRLKNSGRVMACYACNYINSYYGKRYVESMKAGVAQQNFGAKALDKMPIFIPPMDEQIAFENFVERSYRTKLILLKGLEQMETLKKALMQQYFG